MKRRKLLNALRKPSLVCLPAAQYARQLIRTCSEFAADAGEDFCVELCRSKLACTAGPFHRYSTCGIAEYPLDTLAKQQFQACSMSRCVVNMDVTRLKDTIECADAVLEELAVSPPCFDGLRDLAHDSVRECFHWHCKLARKVLRLGANSNQEEDIFKKSVSGILKPLHTQANGAADLLDIVRDLVMDAAAEAVAEQGWRSAVIQDAAQELELLPRVAVLETNKDRK